MSPSPGVRFLGGGPGRGFNRVIFLLAASLCLQCLLWRSRQRLERLPALQRLGAGVGGDEIRSTSTSIWTGINGHEDRHDRQGGRIPSNNSGSLAKRMPLTGLREDREDNSHPRLDPEEDSDESNDTLLNIDYTAWYESVDAKHRWIAFTILVVWSIFLFSTIGISASDFFCPNLATVADRLGLSESTAGVTFLAFGNGSPDVFSTFSALRSNTFSLAIGELLGAAAFITTVVVGAMALVRPFHVPRWPFLRDVGFFCIAVLVMITCLADGKLKLFEAGGMIALYVVYVIVVVGGNWWLFRKEREQELMNGDGISSTKRSERDRIRLLKQIIPASQEEEEQRLLQEEEDDIDEGENVEGENEDPNTSGDVHMDHLAPVRGASPKRSRNRASSNATIAFRAKASPSGSRPRSRPTSLFGSGRSTPNLIDHLSPRLEAGTAPRRISLHSQGHRRPVPDAPRPTFSLLGAIEFRDAMKALRKESQTALSVNQGGGDGSSEGQISGGIEDADIAEYFGPTSPFPRGHYNYLHRSPSARSPSTIKLGTSRPFIPSTRSVSYHARTEAEDDHSPPGISVEDGDWRKSAAGGISASREESSGRDVDNEGLGNPHEEDGLIPPPLSLDGKTEATQHVSKVIKHQLPKLPIPELTIEVYGQQIREPAMDSGYSEEHSTAARFSKSLSPSPLRILRSSFHILFPSLHNFNQKSIIGRILAIVAAPALLALTVTLPVVDDAAEGYCVNKAGIQLCGSDTSSAHEETVSDVEEEDRRHVAGLAGSTLHRLVIDTTPQTSPRVEHTINPLGHHAVHKDEDDESIAGSESSETEILLFNKYLTAVQCILAPLFFSIVLFSDQPWGIYAIPCITTAGIVTSFFVLSRAHDGSNPWWRMVRCIGGFFSAMMWIAAIADEVVEVLKTFGHIMGLSNALIGLTIFAVGNSCADLIANLTVASFAPSMSYAACFGGPMLNLLLGVGGAGTMTILSTGQPYPVHFSPTLWVSAIGLVVLLVITLIFVPLNGFFISRKWAIFLICFYAVMTILNVVVETRRMGGGSTRAFDVLFGVLG